MSIIIHDDLTADLTAEDGKICRLVVHPLTGRPFSNKGSLERFIEKEVLPNEARYFVSPPTPVELAEIKGLQIEDDFQASVAAIRSGYTDDEIKSWDKQEREARACIGNPGAVTPLLDAMLVGRSVSDEDKAAAKQSLAASIIQKADNYAAAYGAALGLKQARVSALAAIDLEADGAADLIAQI